MDIADAMQCTGNVSEDVKSESSEYGVHNCIPSEINPVDDVTGTATDAEDGLLKSLKKLMTPGNVSKSKKYEISEKSSGGNTHLNTRTSKEQHERSTNQSVSLIKQTDPPTQQSVPSTTGIRPSPAIHTVSAHVHRQTVSSQAPPRPVQPTVATSRSRVSPGKTRRILPRTPVQDPDVYDFRHQQRGHLVLIVNDKFYRQTSRDGAEFDLMKAKAMAFKLGFRIFNQNRCRNLSKTDTLEVLREAQRMDHSNSDCFAFLISSHGMDYPNPRKRGKMDHALICSDDGMIFTSTILEMFSDRNCPTLQGKPKIFFIQACRGNSVDDGAELHVRESTSVKDRASPLWISRADDSASATDNAVNTRGLEDKANADSIVHQPSTDSINDGKRQESVDDKHSSRTEVQQQPPGIDESDVRASGDSWATGSAHQYRDTAHAQITSTQRHGTVHREGGIPFIDEEEHSAPLRRGFNVKPNEYQTRAPSEFTSSVYEPKPKPFPIVDTPVFRCDPDFLVMYAIPPGMFAWRNTQEGSWMIDFLHQVVKAYDMKRPKSFLSLLTKVTRLMSERQTNVPGDSRTHAKKAISVIENKLTKDIYFTPKIDFDAILGVKTDVEGHV